MTTPSTKCRFTTAVAFALAFLPMASAQAYYGRSVEGPVTDGKEPVTNATVFLKSEETLATRSYLTKASGTYAFRHMQPNQNYALWATVRGRSSKKKRLSVFDRKAQRRVTLVIPR